MKNPTLKKCDQCKYRHLLLLLFLAGTKCLCSQNIAQMSKQDPIKFSGSLGISTVFFNAEGRRTNRKPFTWLLRGDPTLSIYGIDIPISIVVSEQERDFRQPFNRFGISPYYKWAKLYVGYQNLNFSKYSLAGHAMVGAGFELRPDKFRIGYMNGRLLKAVQPNQLIEDSDYFAIPAFQRNGQAFKFGYGTDANFVDLIFLKASDDLSTIDSIPQQSGLQPAANNILSVVSKQRVNDQIRVEFEYAQSIYTNDIRSDESDAIGGVFQTFSFLTDSRTSSEVSTALDASIDYQLPSFGAKLRIERVSPNYRSMGAYFFLNDMQKITVEPRLNLWKKKITINTSLGFQKNNLQDQKSLQTNRTVGSVRITARPTSNYTININYSNYGVAQKEGLVNLNDQNFISQVTKNWGLVQNYQISNQSFLHNAMLSYQRQQLSDKNPATSDFANYSNNTLFFNYNFSYLPLKLGANLNYTYSKFAIQDLTTIYQGPNISIQSSFLQNKLRVSLGQSFLKNKTNDNLQRKVNKTSLRASYKLNKAQKMSFRYYFNKGQSFSDQVNPFNETKIDLQYVYRFL